MRDQAQVELYRWPDPFFFRVRGRITQGTPLKFGDVSEEHSQLHCFCALSWEMGPFCHHNFEGSSWSIVSGPVRPVSCEAQAHTKCQVTPGNAMRYTTIFLRRPNFEVKDECGSGKFIQTPEHLCGLPWSCGRTMRNPTSRARGAQWTVGSVGEKTWGSAGDEGSCSPWRCVVYQWHRKVL